MTESSEHGGKEYKNLPLPLSHESKPEQGISPSQPSETKSPFPTLRPRTPEERAEELYADQGIVSKDLPPSAIPPKIVRKEEVPTLDKFMTEAEIQYNLDNGLPPSATRIPYPDPRNRIGERDPRWRGPYSSEKRNRK